MKNMQCSWHIVRFAHTLGDNKYSTYLILISYQKQYEAYTPMYCTAFSYIAFYDSLSSPDLPTTGGSLNGPVPLTVMAATITE